MNLLNKINCNRIREGVSFTEDVYFDDGENLFLIKNKAVKPYHIACLKRWAVPYLLSEGHESDVSRTVYSSPKKEKVEYESVDLGDFGLVDDEDEYLSSTPVQNSSPQASASAPAESDDDIEELEELEELEEI